jgi:hypothetical protein
MEYINKITCIIQVIKEMNLGKFIWYYLDNLKKGITI